MGRNGKPLNEKKFTAPVAHKHNTNAFRHPSKKLLWCAVYYKKISRSHSPNANCWHSLLIKNKELFYHYNYYSPFFCWNWQGINVVYCVCLGHEHSYIMIYFKKININMNINKAIVNSDTFIYFLFVYKV